MNYNFLLVEKINKELESIKSDGFFYFNINDNLDLEFQKDKDSTSIKVFSEEEEVMIFTSTENHLSLTLKENISKEVLFNILSFDLNKAIQNESDRSKEKKENISYEDFYKNIFVLISNLHNKYNTVKDFSKISGFEKNEFSDSIMNTVENKDYFITFQTTLFLNVPQTYIEVKSINKNVKLLEFEAREKNLKLFLDGTAFDLLEYNNINWKSLLEVLEKLITNKIKEIESLENYDNQE